MYSGSLPQKRLRMSLIATVIALSALLFVTVSALASTVNIFDNAGVLNASQIRSQASSLPYPISIYTSNFTGTKNQFDQTAMNKVQANIIVIAIDTNQHHLDVFYGRNVPLSRTQTDNAGQAFGSAYQSNRSYTDATIACIRSLQSSLGSSSYSPGNSAAPVASTGYSLGSSFGAIFCVGLLIIAGIAVFAIIRRRGSFNRPFNNQPYNQPYNQPNYPPNYPPNYGPGYPPQNQGMNPWAAGGLGAAAGGFVGYELGKEAGEREAERDRGGDFGNSDFGGGSSGDFGGGGGGSDFGGGSSGDFGGGGGSDFGGGGGGGSDFGGGSSSGF